MTALKQGLIDWLRQRGSQDMTAVMDHTCRMQIMDRTGHREVSWNPSDPNEVNVARETFARMISKGYQAFYPGKSRGYGGRIAEFDPAIELMILLRWT